MLNAEEKVRLVLSLNDDDFKSELSTATALVRYAAKDMQQNAKINMKFSAEELNGTIILIKGRLLEIKDELENTDDPARINTLNKEAQELNNILEYIKNNLHDIISESEEGTKKLEINLKGSIKQAGKLALGLVGIRSVWGILLKATHQYMSENQDINNQLKITFSILGNLIGPVIRGLVTAVQYIAVAIAKVIYAFTKFNVLANVTKKAIKGVGSSAKNASKALAAFDTITNLTEQGTGVGGINAKALDEAWDKFEQIKKDVDEFWKDWGKYCEAGVIALGTLWGVKTLSGIATLLGAKGLGGILSSLSTIGSMAVVIAIGVALNIYQKQQIEKEIDELTQPRVIEMQIKWNTENEDVEGAINSHKTNVKSLREEIQSLQIVLDNPIFTMFNNAFLINVEKRLKMVNKEVVVNKERAKQYKDILKTEGVSLETVDEIYGVLIQQKGANNELLDLYKQAEVVLDACGEDTSYIKQHTQDVNESQKDLIEILNYIDDNYKIVNGEIIGMKDSIDEVNNYPFDTKWMKIKLDVDTSNLDEATTKSIKNMGNSLSGLFNTILGKDNKLSLGIANVLSKLPKYDIGTNFVPQDTLAMVHKGEMIVPKKYNPSTSNLGAGSEETNMLLRQLNNTLENKQFNGVISAKEIVNTAIDGINQQSRIMGRSVV